MKKIVMTAMAVAIGTSLVGCSETLHKKQEQQPDVVNSSKQQQDIQHQLVAIAVEQGKTNVAPFVQVLGQPQSEKLISKELVQVAWVSNRLLTAKQGETPVIVILPANDPRLEKMPKRGLIIQAKKVNYEWFVDALHLGPLKAQGEKKL